MAARLSLADHLAHSSKNVVELAKLCNLPVQIMKRLLRSEQEHRSLLAQAGFELTKIILTTR